MTDRSFEAYGDFAWAFDEPLGRPFFTGLAPLLDGVLERNPPPGRSHLDLACGTALSAPWFAERGFETIGVDASLPMLLIAASRIDARIAGDLRAVPTRGDFALVTCLYDSLNHLRERGDLDAALAEMRRLATSGGLVVFDVNHPDGYGAIWGEKEPFVSEGRDYSLTMYTTWTKRTGEGAARIEGWAVRGGRRVEIREVRRQKAWARREIEKALRRAGLTLAETFDFDPFGDPDDEPRPVKMLFAARSV